jgi:hypothetical protein
MTTYVVPVLALLWGTLDHETISTQQMFAIGGVLAMVALVQTGSRAATADEITDVPQDASTLQSIEPKIALVPTPEFAAPASLVAQPESQVA